MALNSIASLLGQHRGQEAWVFGKGPSLDAFDFERAGKLRICINESLWRVPSPLYFFAHDERPIERVAPDWPVACRAILEPSRAQFAFECGIPTEQIASYEKHQALRSLDLEVMDASNRNQLIGMTGTVHSALHFCKLVGAKRIHMIGFDGAGPYAPSLGLETPVGGGQHDRIRSDSIRLLEALAMPYQFIQVDSDKSDEGFDYQTLYDRLRQHGYHESEDDGTHLSPYMDWIVENLNPSSVLDIGCSAGKSLELFLRLGIESTGIDVSRLAVEKGQHLGRRVIEASATSLPFEDNSFDLVCSADVFEHLHPDDCEKACMEAIRVAKRFVFMKIAEKVDATEKWKALAGHPLHLTTRTISWWQDQFRPFGSITYSKPEVFCLDQRNTTG